MIKLAMIKTVITKTIGRSGLIVKKYSPEILMGVGIIGVITSTVMACKATLKVDEVLHDTRGKLNRIKDAGETEETVAGEAYSKKDYQKDMTITYVQTGVEFIKLYGPAVTLGVASIACILGAHNIMQKRNVALVAAYKAVEQSFNYYRKRVVEEFGEDKDRQFKYGLREETITVIEEDADGKKKKVKKTIEVVDVNGCSQYARFFDEASIQWCKTPEHNLVFLRCQQNYMNDLLHARGHLFLNEVYDELGIPRSSAGALVGWVMDQGDNFVDFGMYNSNTTGYGNDHHCDTINEERRDFINGYRTSILLDFNVDGIMYDML